MNERIDELMIQAGARFEFLHGVHYDNFQYKTFARLIIKDCLLQAEREMLRNGTDSVHNIAIRKVMESIQKHFGVVP